MTSIPVPDGTTQPAYVARPAHHAEPTGVIVAHELFGVSPDIRGVADDLAAAGYLAVAPEFYHRDAPAGAWFPRDAAGRAEGFLLLGRLTRQQALDDIAAAAAWLRSQPGITRIAVIGFSAGGHLAYLAACESPDVDVAAVLYGGWLTAPAAPVPLSGPTPTLDLTPGIRGKLLYLAGDEDFLIDAAQREQIAAALRDAGVDHELVLYPGTGHAFFWPGTPEYRQKSRDDAWSRILTLLAAG
jgi:carboxymethylenebutenolidase